MLRCYSLFNTQHPKTFCRVGWWAHGVGSLNVFCSVPLNLLIPFSINWTLFTSCLINSGGGISQFWSKPGINMCGIECSVNFLCILSRATQTQSWMSSIILIIDLFIDLDCLTLTYHFLCQYFLSTGNWILERSIDGETFEPWQYYAITDTECLTRFNINPRTGPPSYTRDDEVICTSFYSKIHPLENGEVTIVEVVSLPL